MPRTLVSTALVTALAVTGCGKKPEPTVAPGGPVTDGSGVAKPTVESLTAAKPDFTFNAEEWHAECKQDEAAAKKKYGGKVIEVTGEVSSVVDQPPSGKDPGLALVHLTVKKDILGVRADCPADSWKKAIPKRQVTVRGLYGENSFLTGELFPCALVKADGNVKTYQASDLAKELIADPEKANKAHDKEWCWVEGKLLASETDKFGVFSLNVEGSGAKNLSCGIPADLKKKVEALPAGTKVKVFGELTAYSVNGGSLSMSYARVE